MIIAAKLDAIKRLVSFGCVALSILQILAIKHPHLIWEKYGGWLETIRHGIPFVGVVFPVIREEYCFHFDAFSDTELYRIITEKQRK